MIFLALLATGTQTFRICKIYFLIRQLPLGFAGPHVDDIFLLIVIFYSGT